MEVGIEYEGGRAPRLTRLGWGGRQGTAKEDDEQKEGVKRANS